MRRTCSVRGLVCLVTRKLLRFWKYAVIELSRRSDTKSAPYQCIMPQNMSAHFPNLCVAG